MNSMKVPFRSIVTAAILLSLVWGLFPQTASQAAQKTPKLSWKSCYHELGFPFECAEVSVPLDYSKPGEATISIAMVRLPAADPAHKIGSIFFNPGGPGGSGVDFILGVGPFLYTDELRARFDLVGFDPRGIARSTQLRCFDSADEWEPYFTPFAFPITPEEDAIWRAADLYLVDACARHGNRIINHMSTANVARDLDMLRQAVGDEKLTYAGYSYGSFLGVTYANLFPKKVRALVVDGVLEPIAWTTGEPGEADTLPFSTRLHSDKGAAATLNEFFRLCDENPGQCAFSGGAADRYAALAASLRAAPVEIQLPDGSTILFLYQDLIGNTLGAMYDSFSWPDFALFLADLEAMASPDQLGMRLDAFWADLGLAKKRDPEYRNFVEGFPGVACSDSENPHDYSAWWNAAQQAEAESGYFGPLWTYASSICSDWPARPRGRYLGPFTARTSNPVLVVGNYFDPATPYEGAQKVAELLPNSRLLSVNAWGHVSLFLSQCADQAVAAYLLKGTLPRRGTVCQQDLTPFVDMGPPIAAAGTTPAHASLVPILVPEVVRKGVEKGR